MRDVKKYAQDGGEMSRLRRENSELRDRLREKELELDGARQTISEMEEEYNRLVEQYDRYLFDYSERIEEVTEARIAYEQQAKRLRTLIIEYRKEAEKWISAMKKQGEVVS